MTNEEMLRSIEYLREKADVSYEEAQTLLERFDGNVMRVLVELERQGRVYTGGQTEGANQQSTHTYTNTTQKRQPTRSETKDKATSFINNAFRHHLVVESGTGENKKTVADLSAPYCVGAAIIAPHLAFASAAIAFLSGYRVKIKKVKGENVIPDDVETFVDKTVSNIKQTASSVSETIRGDKDNNPTHKDDHNNDDEGGEITVE